MIDAEGVTKATPAVAEEFVAVGGVAIVTATPPAEYPAPDTSPLTVYAVVAAFTVADARYNAALKASVAPDARMGAVPKLCVPVINSPINEVHIDCVFATLVLLLTD